MADQTDLTREVDAALTPWRQGDLVLNSNLVFAHLALLSNPLTPAARDAKDELAGDPGPDQTVVMSEAPGFVVLSQSCDLVRPSHDRPLVELAALIAVSPQWVEEIRRLKRPSFAYLPTVAGQNLVVDLDRTMTVEKAVLAPLRRQAGVTTAAEAAAFAQALARKRARFAFPDAFNTAFRSLFRRLDRRAGKDTPEGHHVDALIEIRAAATPAWDAPAVNVLLWLIKSHDPDPQQWPQWIDQWVALIDQTGVYKLDGHPTAILLGDMRASDYVASHQIDFDQLTPPA